MNMFPQNQQLYKAYETIGNLISSQENVEENDDEEMEARRVVQEENWEVVNSKSVTIRVNNSEGEAWEQVLKKNFGTHIKNSSKMSDNKGEKYVTTFTVDEEECNMYMTMYKQSKNLPGKRTILIQIISSLNQ